MFHCFPMNGGMIIPQFSMIHLSTMAHMYPLVIQQFALWTMDPLIRWFTTYISKGDFHCYVQLPEGSAQHKRVNQLDGSFSTDELFAEERHMGHFP